MEWIGWAGNRPWIGVYGTGGYGEGKVMLWFFI